MTGLSLALQLLICEPSTSRISSESAGLATSSWCGRTLSYNSQGQVFQPRKTGPHRSVCLCPLLLKLSIFSGDMGLHIRQDFAAHCDFFCPLEGLAFGCLDVRDPVWSLPRVIVPPGLLLPMFPTSAAVLMLLLELFKSCNQTTDGYGTCQSGW